LTFFSAACTFFSSSLTSFLCFLSSSSSAACEPRRTAQTLRSTLVAAHAESRGARTGRFLSSASFSLENRLRKACTISSSVRPGYSPRHLSNGALFGCLPRLARHLRPRVHGPAANGERASGRLRGWRAQSRHHHSATAPAKSLTVFASFSSACRVGGRLKQSNARSKQDTPRDGVRAPLDSSPPQLSASARPAEYAPDNAPVLATALWNDPGTALSIRHDRRQ
jgi:hypothetical protein